MKTPVVLIIALAMLAFATYFALSPQPPGAVGPPAAATQSSPTPSKAAAKPAGDNPVQASVIKPSDARPHDEAKPQAYEQSVRSETRSARAQLPQEDRQQMAACRALWEGQKQREQAAHDAETKDPAWAYEMEQKLREAASPPLQAVSIELVEVDCKTTFCDLIAKGFAPESTNEFDEAVEQVKKQPWSDFTGASMSNSSNAGRVTYTAELRRQRSYVTPFEAEDSSEANLACMRLVSQRAQQERAARDAQPRDAAWADQTEALLRQHITGRLVKHPVEQLSIDCKTTFCRVMASGKTQDSRQLFQQVAREAATEPWADLRVGETGSTGYGDSWKSELMMYRR